MARKTHRDVGTLSRFETGKATPRDVGWLVAQYHELHRPPVETQREPIRATSHVGFYAIYFGRWMLLAIVELAAIRADHERPDTIRADEWRLFLVISTAFFVAHRLYRTRPQRTLQDLVIILRGTLPPLILSAVFISHLGRGTVDLPVEFAALIWIELGFWAWEFNLYRAV